MSRAIAIGPEFGARTQSLCSRSRREAAVAVCGLDHGIGYLCNRPWLEDGSCGALVGKANCLPPAWKGAGGIAVSSVTEPLVARV